MIGEAIGTHFGTVLMEHLTRNLEVVKETMAEMAKHREAMAIAADAVQEMLGQGRAQGTDNVTGNSTQLADAVGNVLACTDIAVPARLGLKALGLAWLPRALACKM